MIYNEEDIDFMVLSDKRFEELCFDLLLKQGFRGLAWRQGGPDSGRDIEGYFPVTCPTIDTYDEKWFVECKRYREGVPVGEITSKIAWADAERPKHLAIIVSSYLSNSTRDWLTKISPQKPYAIHSIEGKKLKKLLLSYPDIISEYFIDKYSKLLRDSQRNLLVHNLLPEPATLHVLTVNLDPAKLTSSDLAFLLCSVLFVDEEMQSWCEINEYFKMDHFFANLKNHASTKESLVEQLDDYQSESWAFYNNHNVAAYGNSQSVLTFEHTFITTLDPTNQQGKSRALYACVRLSEVAAVEILMEIRGSFPTKIRYMKDQNIAEAIRQLELTIFERRLNK